MVASNDEVAAYLRVSSLAIALFDFVQTVPGEIRLYSRQTSPFNLSPACILFILIRYISVAALVTSNVGFFASGFSHSDCQKFYLTAPVLKLVATLVSQIIISVRTYAVSRKTRWVLWTLVVLFVICLVPEVLGNVVRRVVSQKNGNCTSGNLPGAKLAWLHYLAAMIFDAYAMGVATYYLYTATAGLNMMSDFTRMMLEEGLLFFLALTSFNVLNVILFQSNDLALQSAATTLGQAITMIFSEKFILNLSDSAFARSSRDHSSRQPARARSPSMGRFARSTFFSPGGRSFVADHPQTVELGIRVEKDVQITMDDLKYGQRSPDLPSHTDDGESLGSTAPGKAVTWSP